MIRSDLTIIKVNEALTELLGYSARELEGTKIIEYACEEYKAHWCHLQKELWEKKCHFLSSRWIN
ncbi:PAS domain-containing protein [Pedobacter mendelii]|uniref:PAS domain-containing protein n=1 Tax=Pedobacter mendelii TaxID=1908240 RepID=UPI0036174387